MTRIEKVVREISDLRDFYLRISQEKKRFGKKDAGNLQEVLPASKTSKQISPNGRKT